MIREQVPIIERNKKTKKVNELSREDFDNYAANGRFLDEGLIDIEKYYLAMFKEIPGYYYYVGRKDDCDRITSKILESDEFEVISEKTVIDRFRSKSNSKVLLGRKSKIMLMLTQKDHSLVSKKTREKFPNSYLDSNAPVRYSFDGMEGDEDEISPATKEEERKRDIESRPANSIPFNILDYKMGLGKGIAENSSITSINFYYQVNSQAFIDLSAEIDEIVKNSKEEDPTERKAGIYILYQTQNGIRKQWYQNHLQDINIPLSYSKELNEGYDYIKEQIAPMGRKGLILMTGDPGSGKTTMIKQMSKEITGKDFIFVPSTSAKILADPAFMPFLLENPNSVLVIEEAQDILKDRDKHPGATDAVASLLNITDGLLSDALNIVVICTSNSKIVDIDKALLRDGRLIAEMVFTYITAEHANKIAEYYKVDKKFDDKDEKISLASIFCKNTFRIEKVEKKKIGFGKNTINDASTDIK